MVWRKGKTSPGTNPGNPVIAPPGYRDSGRPLFGSNEVLLSTYQVRSLLATDAGGQLFEAWDMVLERVVALKGAWRDQDAPPLVHEARMIRAIQHPCAAQIHCMGIHHSLQFAVAERITGTPLRQHLAALHEAGELLPLADALHLIGLLARGLAAVHQASFTVPDLCTHNLVLTPGPRLVMSRFAFGQGEHEATPPILAPEVITGAAAPAQPGTRAGVAVDLYALGCVAVELLTGKPPFPGDSLKAITFAHVRQRPPQISSLRSEAPAELDDLVFDLLAKQPEGRPESADEVVAQIAALHERVSAGRRPLRVLIVDGEPARTRALWSLVRRAHACTVVDTARDAEEALALFQNERPDIMLLDMQLPGSMNGFELLMYLQGLGTDEPCDVVALSDTANERDARLLAQLGVLRVLPRGQHTEIMALVRQRGPRRSV